MDSVAYIAYLAAALLALAGLPSVRPAAARDSAAADYAVLGGCGGSQADRLCLAYPDGCTASNTCTLMVTARPDPASSSTKFLFEMAAQYTGYVAVALAESELMGVDSVVECVLSEDRVKLFQSVNKAYNATTGKRGNSRLPDEDQKGVDQTGGMLKNGVVSCTFSRDQVTTVRGKGYDLAKPWYLQAAAGNRINNDTSIHHHLEWVTSGSAVRLSSPGLVTDSHGSRRSPKPNGVAPSAAASSVALALVAVLSAAHAL